MPKKYNDDSKFLKDWTTEKLQQEAQSYHYFINVAGTYGSKDVLVYGGILRELERRGIEPKTALVFEGDGKETMQTRGDFMAFFRDDEKLNLLTADDRKEIFSQILSGTGDFTKEFLEEVINDYDVTDIEIAGRKNKEQTINSHKGRRR